MRGCSRPVHLRHLGKAVDNFINSWPRDASRQVFGSRMDIRRRVLEDVVPVVLVQSANLFPSDPLSSIQGGNSQSGSNLGQTPMHAATDQTRKAAKANSPTTKVVLASPSRRAARPSTPIWCRLPRTSSTRIPVHGTARRWRPRRAVAWPGTRRALGPRGRRRQRAHTGSSAWPTCAGFVGGTLRLMDRRDGPADGLGSGRGGGRGVGWTRGRGRVGELGICGGGPLRWRPWYCSRVSPYPGCVREIYL